MSERKSALLDFEERFHDDSVVMNKFFSAQSASQRKEVLADIELLEEHRCYDAKNPNKVRSLIGGFCRNLVAFHAKDGSGYGFVAQHIMAMDAYNPSMASALARFFAKYPTLKPELADLMKKELSKILLKPGLSGDTYEIVSKTLAAR
jgi:aminopeptidase N